jgi:hypothetical protein
MAALTLTPSSSAARCQGLTSSAPAATGAAVSATNRWIAAATAAASSPVAVFTPIPASLPPLPLNAFAFCCGMRDKGANASQSQTTWTP